MKLEESTLPIRLLPTPTKCGMHPFPGVQPVKGPVDDQIVARINELRIKGETDDQVVWRMMRETFSEEIDK
jgi:hypothetical protein